MAVTGGFISNRLWLRTAARTASGSASRRPTTKWSGWTAATPCGAVAAGGKSARLNVTITVAPASMAAAIEAIVLVGQGQRRDPRLEAPDPGLGDRPLHQGPGPLQLGSGQVGPIGQEVAGPFLVD